MSHLPPKHRLFPRTAGVLLHPTSLPGPYGIGDLGASARLFVDWLASARMSVWQMLPLVPPGAADSPYASPSALAGNPWLIDLDSLLHDGLLARGELNAPDLPRDYVDFGATLAFKAPLLDRAAGRLATDVGHPLHGMFRAFAQREPWAVDAALFQAIRARCGGQPWWMWPDDLRRRQPAALERARRELMAEIDRGVALQFLFDRQLQDLRRHAHARGVRFFGDVPIYVDGDSADTWTNPHLFQLDTHGRPRQVAGVPPDYFSVTGQLWGNPLYDWRAMAADGYRWWIARIRRALAQTDLVRIDHFRGFSAYWSIPAGSLDARTGVWLPGPGPDLFRSLKTEFGELPLIAEDLGVVDDEMIDLRDSAGLPGMLVLQFAFGADARNPFLPHNHVEHRVVYSGTHDNDTVLGWWQSSSDGVRDHVRRYLGVDGRDISWDFIRTAFASVAHTAVVPMQDVLDLDGRARMNTPGVTEGNWAWRVRAEALNPDRAGRLAELAWLFDRTR